MNRSEVGDVLKRRVTQSWPNGRSPSPSRDTSASVSCVIRWKQSLLTHERLCIDLESWMTGPNGGVASASGGVASETTEESQECLLAYARCTSRGGVAVLAVVDVRSKPPGDLRWSEAGGRASETGGFGVPGRAQLGINMLAIRVIGEVTHPRARWSEGACWSTRRAPGPGNVLGVREGGMIR